MMSSRNTGTERPRDSESAAMHMHRGGNDDKGRFSLRGVTHRATGREAQSGAGGPLSSPTQPQPFAQPPLFSDAAGMERRLGGGDVLGAMRRRVLPPQLLQQRLSARIAAALRWLNVLKADDEPRHVRMVVWAFSSLLCGLTVFVVLLLLLLLMSDTTPGAILASSKDARARMLSVFGKNGRRRRGGGGGGGEGGYLLGNDGTPSTPDWRLLTSVKTLPRLVQQLRSIEEARRANLDDDDNNNNNNRHHYVDNIRSGHDVNSLLAEMQTFMDALHRHDPKNGLEELRGFLTNVRSRPELLAKAHARAAEDARVRMAGAEKAPRSPTFNTSTTFSPAAAADAVTDPGAEWNAALKEAFAGRGESARLRAQLRGFVAVPAAQAERVTRRPFDDVALLQYRHAWAAAEVLPAVLGRRARVAAVATAAAGAAVAAYDVASRAALKADVYEAASVHNHVHYQPLRRYAAVRGYAGEGVAEADAWYAEVAAAVQARCGAAVTTNAAAAGAGDVPLVSRGPPLSALSLRRLSAAREAEVTHLLAAEDRAWMPEALRASAAVNTQTLFVSLASYRDAECPPTLLDLFRTARNPHRVYVGLAQQNRVGDTPCMLPEMYGAFLCPSDGAAAAAAGAAGGDGFAARRESLARLRTLRTGSDLRARHAGTGMELFDERVCFLSDHVRVRDIDGMQAKGPTYGRYMAMLLYRGEDLTLVLDSHNKFRPSWDTLGFSFLAKFRDPKAALSHYPEAYEPSEPNFDPFRSTASYLCKAIFHDLFCYLQHRAMVIERLSEFANNNVYNDPYVKVQSSSIREEENFRLPQPFIAGGFLFANASIFRDVPFDPHLMYVFDGEETLYAVRLWTHGYNLYSPPLSICFHIYGRTSAPKLWTNNDLWYVTQDLVRPRIQYLLQSHRKNETALMVPADTTNPYVMVDLDRYGMGKQRSVAQWYDYAGADPVNHSLDGRWCDVALE